METINIFLDLIRLQVKLMPEVQIYAKLPYFLTPVELQTVSLLPEASEVMETKAGRKVLVAITPTAVLVCEYQNYHTVKDWPAGFFAPYESSKPLTSINHLWKLGKN